MRVSYVKTYIYAISYSNIEVVVVGPPAMARRSAG